MHTESNPHDNYPMSRKAFLFLVLFFGIGYPLLAMLNCYYISVESNVLFTGGLLAQTLWLLCNLFSALFFSVLFSTLTVSLCKRPTKNNLPIILLAFGSLVYKYSVNLLIVYLFDGFPTKLNIFGNDLLEAFFGLLPELIEVLVVWLIVRAVGEHYRALVAISSSAVKYLPDQLPNDRFRLYPYRAICDRSNPLLAGALYASLVNLAMRLFSFVLGELSLTIGGGWAPSTLADWLAIAGELLFEIALSVGGFFMMRWLSGQFWRRTTAKRD